MCHLFVAVQSLSRIRLFATPWTTARQVSASFTISWSISCLLSQWRHPTISSFIVPFSSCLQSFSASGSFHLVHCLSGSLSPSLLLIPPILFFLYDWSFFTFSSSLLKFSLCSSILFLNWVSLLTADALNSVSGKLCISASLGFPYCFNWNKSFCLLILLIFLCMS